MDDPLVRNDRELAANLQRDFRDLSKRIRGFERDLNSIGSSSDTEEWRNNLRKRIDSVTHECKSVRESLLELESLEENNNKYQIEKLKKQFTKEVDKLRDIVQQINLKERQFKPKQNGSTNGFNTKNSNNPFANEIDTPFKQDVPMTHGSTDNRGGQRRGFQSSNQQQQQEQQQFEVHVDVDELEKREEKVYGLLDQLTELNEIYGDLHELVDEQEEHIQVLGNNVEQAKDDVQSGVQHLDQAAQHQKSYRKKMCWMLIIILVIAAVIVAIYFATDSSKKK